MMLIHYHRDTGRISAWGNGWSDSSHVADHEIIGFLDEAMIVTPATHRIDVETGAYVAKTAAEIATENAPRLAELEMIVRGALAASDEYVVADRKVDNRAAWVSYRQALRDLSKLPDVGAMIDTWPLRPDGIDAVAGLRDRLAAARSAQGVAA